MSYKGPLKDVSTWRGIFEPSTVTSFIERERVRIGYELPNAYMIVAAEARRKLCL